MPRYFFAINDDRSLQDGGGTELPNIAAAQKEAARRAGELLADNKGDLWDDDDEGWRLDVSDAAGLVLFSLVFFAVVAPAGPRATVTRAAAVSN